jgi:hypothetical protein
MKLKKIRLVINQIQNLSQAIPRFDNRKNPNKEENKEETPDNFESPLKKLENREIAMVLDRNIKSVKRYLSTLIQSIFDNISTIPVGLKILCKILYDLSKKKVINV